MSKNTLRLIANIERIGIHLSNRVVLIRCDAVLVEYAPDLFHHETGFGQIRGFCNNITNETFKLALGCRPENYSVLDFSSGDCINGRFVFKESTMKFDDKTLLVLHHAVPSNRLYVAKYSDLGSVAEDMVKKVREYSYLKLLERSPINTV